MKCNITVAESYIQASTANKLLYPQWVNGSALKALAFFCLLIINSNYNFQFFTYTKWWLQYNTIYCNILQYIAIYCIVL